MSLRLRLTLLYSIILALTLIVFSGVLYLTVSRVTVAVVQTALQEQAKRLVSSGKLHLDNIEYPAHKFVPRETYVQTRYFNGTIIDKTSNLGSQALPLSERGLQMCRAGRSWTETVSTVDGRLLVYSAPIGANNQQVGILQVAQSIADYDQSLAALRRVLVIGGVVVTLAAFGIGWVLAGAALRPIDRITQTAQTIGAERDFDRRVPSTGLNDEIGRLATTFNAMLAQLQDAYRQVEQALHTQRRFAGDASHELRTPLTTIRGNLGLLQRQPPISDEDREAVLDDMVDETDRLMRLVNDLLVLARADAGRQLQSAPIALDPLFEETCRQVRALAPERQFTCAAPEGLAVLGDRDALKQVLLILLDNGLKHTPPNAAITLSAAAEGDQVAISVRDGGPGIPAAVLPHIFERFYRADPSRTGVGAGLGLSIAHALAEAQHGSIGVTSQPGQGSTFTVRLPRTTCAEDDV